MLLHQIQSTSPSSSSSPNRHMRRDGTVRVTEPCFCWTKSKYKSSPIYYLPAAQRLKDGTKERRRLLSRNKQTKPSHIHGKSLLLMRGHSVDTANDIYPIPSSIPVTVTNLPPPTGLDANIEDTPTNRRRTFSKVTRGFFAEREIKLYITTNNPSQKASILTHPPPLHLPVPEPDPPHIWHAHPLTFVSASHRPTSGEHPQRETHIECKLIM